jgi:uncharacterized integral membrane protein
MTLLLILAALIVGALIGLWVGCMCAAGRVAELERELWQLRREGKL